METTEILKNIGERTGGDIYLGIVGPVRVGKSTFIKKFMEQAVIPYVEDEYEKGRMIDELPQSGEGKTIMTTEPKFVPNNAATIAFDDGFMVRTPWYDEAIPFNEAAKTGTQKVIQDHSTIGIVITTDGSIADLPRESYIEAETEVIEELTQIGKPFIIIVNSKDPASIQCRSVVDKLKEKTAVPVLAMAVNRLDENDIHVLLREALYEFPVSEINVQMPKWVSVLTDEHWLKQSVNSSIEESMKAITKLREVEGIVDILNENEYVEKANLATVDTGKGVAVVDLEVKSGLYNQVLKEIIGQDITDKAQLMQLMQEFAEAKREYDAISSALKMVKQTGYGFASASLHDIQLSTPEIVKQGGRYGVRIKAVAPSIHMIKVDVESTFEPIIGSKEQSEELVSYLLRDQESDPQAIWESDIFGRKLADIIKDGMNSKLSMIPETARVRLQGILTKLINRGKGNVIAIVL